MLPVIDSRKEEINTAPPESGQNQNSIYIKKF